ncbi:MAG: hypothetical protein OEM77_07960 [Nitrosopumilus sp.]|nr:hypothetical protein [Nitrosopumilus sp.]MDH3736390.1 hypothetical protein [Nitrosopumilus sp.]MDH3823127.1 hypothetical protein [Nitrosopumilus sp.]MDH3833423.1 hypothetical protein [Nitrosopumilus sp.]
MKSLFVLALFSVVMIGFVGYAEAYDGNLRITKMVSDPTIGDIIPFAGFLSNVEPPENTTVQIKFLDTDGSVIDTFESPVDSQMTLIDEFTNAWLFDFEIDTSKYELLTDTKYLIEVSYEDKIDDKRLVVYPSLEQSIVDTGNAKSDSMMDQESEIPEWVRGVFEFWVEKQISDQELISAIEYLIEIGIIKVDNPLS